MTSVATSINAARVELLLNELRLPGVKAIWPKIAAQSDKEGWPAARFLAALAEHESADRARRRIERHMAEARLPAGKTLAAFDFESVPMVSKAQIMALASGDVWLNTGANLLIFGPPGGGKSHLSAAIGLGHHHPGRSLLQTGSSESALARGGVQRDHGNSGRRDGKRRAGARFQLPANQFREPGISAGICDRLRSGITTEANADVVLPANA
jgi:IstB-like ATP binding protein